MMEALFFLTLCSDVLSSSQVATGIDFSHLHRVKSSTLGDAIREVLEENIANGNQLDIDISASMVGKDIQHILSSLEVQDSDAPSTLIKLAARRNDWTPSDATALLRAMLKRKEESSKKSDAETKDDEIDGTTVNEGDDGEKSDSNNGVKEDDGNLDASSTTFVSIQSLDLGWNNLSQENRGSKNFLKVLQNTIEDSEICPETLRLDVCGLGPAACRALAKGLIGRYAKESAGIKPLSLHLTRNEAIGDAGVAAISAAIRTVASKNEGVTIFDVLDLSACGIGDTGAEALAIALEKHPFCVRHLDLSNNQISDEGAAALGRALSASDRPGKVESLDLSNNKDIGDAGAKAISEAFTQGTVSNISMRSCHIHADGAAFFAKSIRSIGEKKEAVSLRLDLSGNPLGVLRKKSKSGSGKYSATALRSKATATTAAYMNLIGKTVQKGLKDLGIADSGGVDTLESDDEEESRMNGEDEENGKDGSKAKCGALSFADAFIEEEISQDEEDTEEPVDSADEGTCCEIDLGFRHCSFDTRAAEALAAVLLEAKNKVAMKINLDVRMNNVLEEEMVSALQGDVDYEDTLGDMADRYLEAMEALRIARQRSLDAARAAAARVRAEAEMEASWGSPVDMGDDGFEEGYDERWDSDADYDDPEEYSDGYF